MKAKWAAFSLILCLSIAGLSFYQQSFSSPQRDIATQDKDYANLITNLFRWNESTGVMGDPQRLDNSPQHIDMYSIMARQDQRPGELIFQLPLFGQKEQDTFCGIKHMRGPHAPLDEDSKNKYRTRRTKPYMTPTASCMLAGVANEWREKFCPDNSPHCQIIIGDAGYKNKPKHWPHASHKGGDCVDIFMMRKKGHNYNEQTYAKMSTTGYQPVSKKNSANANPYYDRDLTHKFAKLLVKWGIETKKDSKKPQFFLGDPEIIKDKSLGISSSKKVNNVHKDHFHVCWRKNKANYNRCKNFKAKPRFCPQLVKKQELYGRPARAKGYDKSPVLAKVANKPKRKIRKKRRCGPKCRARKRRLARKRKRKHCGPKCRARRARRQRRS